MSWDDPTKMPIYHVQLETQDRIVSYEVATNDYDYVDVAKAHLQARLQEDGPVRVGGTSSIGYHPLGPAEIVTWEVMTGDPLPEAP